MIPTDEQSAHDNFSTQGEGPTNDPKPTAGPLNLEQIRRLRESQSAGESKAVSKPKSRPSGNRKNNQDSPQNNEPALNDSFPPSVDDGQEETSPALVASEPSSTPNLASIPEQEQAESRDRGERFRKGRRSSKDGEADYTASQSFVAPKVSVPNLRQPLAADLENELKLALEGADLKDLMIGNQNLTVGRSIEDGSRQRGRIIKIHQDSVFVSLGGPDEGVIPLLQFTDLPQVDDQVEFLVRGFNRDDGLYELTLPGEATSVDDWNDLQEGLVVEAIVESTNTGGVECRVGNLRGFIPMRQLSEFRIEDANSFLGQRLLCVVTEANPRRGNLVLSHRAVLERERQAKKAERLAKLEIGQPTQGVVRKIMDFGAFVDIGGLDGLLHVSQLSYEKVKHPSEILKEGDTIQVRIESVDPETQKISLSYRSLQEHPWANVETRFPLGAVVKGTVSRLANFGAFVKLATGVEGLIHLSELSHKRIPSVASVVKEGQEVEVKIVSVDKENQRIGLSLKAAQSKPEDSSTPTTKADEENVEPARKPVIGKRPEPLRGGAGSTHATGDKFGLKW